MNSGIIVESFLAVLFAGLVCGGDDHHSSSIYKGYREVSSAREDATTGGTSGGAPCRFPFVYKGVKYNSCTHVDHHRLWCFTDKLSPHIRGRQLWGECIHAHRHGHDSSSSSDKSSEGRRYRAKDGLTSSVDGSRAKKNRREESLSVSSETDSLKIQRIYNRNLAPLPLPKPLSGPSILKGVWSDWRTWTDCRRNCGGNSERTRTCTLPGGLTEGGDSCEGHDIEVRVCQYQTECGYAVR